MAELSLEENKKKYTDALKEFFLSQTSEDNPYLINMATRQALMEKTWRDSTSVDYHYQFKVVTSGGTLHLMVKDLDEYKLMVPYERLFDILWPIHLNHDHVISNTVMAEIHKKYFVPKKAIDIFSSYCDYCKSRDEAKLILERKKNNYTDTLKEMFLTQTSEEYPYLISMDKKLVLNRKIWKEGISKADHYKSGYCNTAYLNLYKAVSVKGGGTCNLMVKDDNEYKLVVPYEELFDILWPIHHNHNHEVSEAVIAEVQKKYFIPKKAIKVLSRYCDHCEKIRLSKAKPYNCCYLELIKMDAYDHCFNSVMVCEDHYTKFIHLRPLSAVNPANQICLELFKIFMDFGTPKQLKVSDDIFVTAVSKFITLTAKSYCTPSDIQIKIIKPREKKASSIKALLKKWSDDSGSYNWAIGCYIVQQQLNSEIQDNHQSAPFENVFVYNKSLQNTPEINDGASVSGESNAGLDTRLEAGSSKSCESNKVPVNTLEDRTTYVTEEEYTNRILTDANSKGDELIDEQDAKPEEPDDKEKVGKLREKLSMILGDEDETHSKYDPVLVEENLKLSDELDDKEKLGKLREKLSMILDDEDETRSKYDPVLVEASLKLSDEPDDNIQEHNDPKEKLTVLLNDDGPTNVKKEEDEILELSSDISCDNLNEEPDDLLDSEYPKCIGIEIESDEIPDVELRESNTTFELSPDRSTCSKSKVTLGDILSNEPEATLDADISRHSELTDKTNTILDDVDQKPVELPTEPVPILADDISKHDILSATLNDDPKCDEMKGPDAILSDPKCVEMHTEQQLTKQQDTIMDN